MSNEKEKRILCTRTLWRLSPNVMSWKVWWSAEVGPLNEVVHIWAYEDLNHRERARKAQGEDPQLQAFRPKAQAMIVSQYNKILTPASFSPLK